MHISFLLAATTHAHTYLTRGNSLCTHSWNVYARTHESHPPRHCPHRFHVPEPAGQPPPKINCECVLPCMWSHVMGLAVRLRGLNAQEQCRFVTKTDSHIHTYAALMNSRKHLYAPNYRPCPAEPRHRAPPKFERAAASAPSRGFDAKLNSKRPRHRTLNLTLEKHAPWKRSLMLIQHRTLVAGAAAGEVRD